MTSYRPYLLRALLEWISDNDMTPHLLVDATAAGVQVPASAIKEGKVVLNIATRAVSGLVVDNHAISFSARFGGASFPVYVPMPAVLAIYSRETGQGMALPPDGENTAEEPMPAQEEETSGNPYLTAVDGGLSDGQESERGEDSPDEPPPSGKRPHLRVVK